MKYIPGNSQHIGARTEQQDSFGFSDPDDSKFTRHGGFLAILADGAGGMDHGRAAGHVAVRTFLESYATKEQTEQIPEALERSLREANAAVHALSEQHGSENNVAATLLASALCGERLHWISVGDSALYLYRDGRLSLLTVSHTYARELDRRAAAGEISPEAASSHPDRAALTSFVGAKVLGDIDRSSEPLSLQAGDRILLSSDGLFNALDGSEIVEELRLQPQQACDSLIQRVLAKKLKHQDNVTVLCIAVEVDECPTIQLSSIDDGRRKRFWFDWRK
jgi:protein phosphatase